MRGDHLGHLNRATVCLWVKFSILFVGTLILFLILDWLFAITDHMLSTELSIVTRRYVWVLEVRLQFLLRNHFDVIISAFNLANVHYCWGTLNVTGLICFLSCYSMLLSHLAIRSSVLVSLRINIHLRTDYEHISLIFTTTFYFGTASHLICSGNVLVETVCDLKVLRFNRLLRTRYHLNLRSRKDTSAIACIRTTLRDVFSMRMLIVVSMMQVVVWLTKNSCCLVDHLCFGSGSALDGLPVQMSLHFVYWI